MEILLIVNRLVRRGQCYHAKAMHAENEVAGEKNTIQERSNAWQHTQIHKRICTYAMQLQLGNGSDENHEKGREVERERVVAMMLKYLSGKPICNNRCVIAAQYVTRTWLSLPPSLSYCGAFAPKNPVGIDVGLRFLGFFLYLAYCSGSFAPWKVIVPICIIVLTMTFDKNATPSVVHFNRLCAL